MDFDSKVVGVTRHNHDGSDRQEIARQCRAGERLTLRREPDNPQDTNSVAVFRENGDQVGYLSASVAERLAPQLDAGAEIAAVVSEVTGGAPETPTYGVNIRIYDEAEESEGEEDETEATAERGAEAAVGRRVGGVAPQARRGCAVAVLALAGGLVTWAIVLAVVLGRMG